MTKTVVGLAAILLLGSALSSAAKDRCEFSEPRQAVLEVGDATELRIDASAGFLRVVGGDASAEVIVEGTACAGEASDLAGIELETGRRGSTLLVEVDLPESDWGWNRYARLDLTVRVPSGLALDIEDGSGEIEISGVGATRIDDGSGSIDVRDVDGDLTDGSGEIEVRDVRIREDGSGSIRAVEVSGDFIVDRDGSGGISVDRVGGRVEIPR